MNTVEETVENITEVLFDQITFIDQIIYNLGTMLFSLPVLKNNV